MMDVKIQDAGDTALLVCFGQQIDPALNEQVLALNNALLALNAMKNGEIVDLVPSYCSLLVVYNPLQTTYGAVKTLILKALSGLTSKAQVKGRQVTLSVDYDPEYGLDQERLKAHTGLSLEEMIRRHSQVPYKVYMLGFLAGFPYLGGLDPSLHTPRLESPRLKIEEGSVGIASGQTGIYTVSSPGGWNIIGRTQHKLFDPSQEDPFLLEAGDTLTFIASKEPILHIEGQKQRPLAQVPRQTTRAGIPFLKVIQPGIQTSVQDYGRFGYLSYGISNAGVMDRSCYLALMTVLDEKVSFNQLEPSSAMLEWVLKGPVLEAVSSGLIAIGGNVKEARINEVPIEPWRVYGIQAGDVLHLGMTDHSLRGYLAVKGGFATADVLGSRSFDKQNALGEKPLEVGQQLLRGRIDEEVFGLQGRCLKEMPEHLSKVAMAHQKQTALEIRVILGPQHDSFTEEGLATFTHTEWEVSQQLNRMGIRLDGEPIEFKTSADIISDGINLGAIQVSGNQQPMIMLHDRQTIGGYAKIANVIEADMSLLAQVSPGMKLKFRPVSVYEAHQMLEKTYAKPVVHIPQDIIPTEVRRYCIKVNGRTFDVLVEPRSDS